MWIKFWAWITGGKVVALKDHDGEACRSIAFVDDFGQLYCYRHWSTKVGRVVLHTDGKVYGHYVQEWKYI